MELKGGFKGMNFAFFVFRPLKRLRVAFSCGVVSTA